MNRLKKRGMWCGPDDFGKSRESAVDFIERAHQAGFNILLPNLKGGHGQVFWKSDLFPHLTVEGYHDFDLCQIIAEECRKRGMEAHAWFMDFFDGGAGQEHPEWAMRDAQGRTTADEMLRGNQFGITWMCPAQRPGYTDQRLIPLYEEFARKYDFHAVHHDYVRYPGDLAPDQYCFCDSCLEDIPRWAGYRTEAYAADPKEHETYDRGYMEAHWEPSPNVLPERWELWDRAMKSRFLLEGNFFPGGRSDLDYFFYTYRVEAILRFTKECAAAVRKARPGMQISAAVFKNPVHSGRFIGQDWRRMGDWVDMCLPMDYRAHYPGDFEMYVDLFAETVRSQVEWASGFPEYYPGIALNDLFVEEEVPLRTLEKALAEGDVSQVAASWHRDELRGWQSLGEAITQLDSDLASEIHQVVESCTAETLEISTGGQQRYLAHRTYPSELEALPSCGPNLELAEKVKRFRQDVKGRYWPADKLDQTVEAAVEAGAEGIIFFCAGHLEEYGLWDRVGELFKRLG